MTHGFLSPSQIEGIHGASLKLLTEIGIHLEGDRERKLMLDHGAVPLPNGRLGITEKMLVDALSAQPKSFHLYGRTGSRDLLIEPGYTYFHTFGGAPSLLDFHDGERRPVRLDDLVSGLIIQDYLEHYDLVLPLIVPQDVPSCGVATVMAATAFRNTGKPIMVTVSTREEMRHILQVAEAVAGGPENLRQKPCLVLGLSPISPLSIPSDISGPTVDAALSGIPLDVLSCPMLGLTSPITLAAGLAQLNAEILSVLVLARLANPEVPVFYGARLVPADMRDGRVVFGSPDFGIACACATQLAGHYGLPADVYGLSTSSHLSDFQGGFEKAINGSLALLSGASLISGGGLLEDGVLSSLEQIVVDHEVIKYIKRLHRSVEANPETIAMEAFHEGTRDGNFLTVPHTLKYLREGELFQSSLALHGTREDWIANGKRTIMDEARDMTETILARHKAPAMDKSLELALNEIVKEACNQ